jgi:hypothetical protein
MDPIEAAILKQNVKNDGFEDIVKVLLMNG